MSSAEPTPQTEPAAPAAPAAPEPAPVVPPEVLEARRALQEAEARAGALEGRLRETEVRLREVSKAYTDLQNDNDAFRRRMNQAADQRLERKAAEIIELFFEPVRNLRRSLDVAASDPAQVVAGIAMIRQQFDDVMLRLGLQEIPGEGSAFDPNIHEALAIQPVVDRAQDNKVLAVYATGYRLGSKVLQPAQVVVGKFAEADA